MLGEVFNGYRVDSLLGEGGIGQVYAAEHLTLGHQVALKVLLEEHENTPKLRKRFEREAKALSDLSHPHIVSITDVGVTEDGMPYLVMERLQGETLASYLRTHSVDPDTAIMIASQLLSAMGYAHQCGIAHRDLKPQNIFVRPLDDDSLHVTVLDFGLVRFLDEGLRNGTKLTRKGAVLGTPAYMAPEQAAGGEADERADVYAAGLILYEMLAGRRPFTSRNPIELRRAHLAEPPPRLTEADPGLEVDDSLEEFMERALAKDATERFADAEAMLGALRSLPEGAARRTSPQQQRSTSEPSTPDGTADTVAARPGSQPFPQTRLGSNPDAGVIARPAVETASVIQADSPTGQPSDRTWIYTVGTIGVLGFVVLGGLVVSLFFHLGPAEELPSRRDSARTTAKPPSAELRGETPAEQMPAAPPASDERGSPMTNLPFDLQALHDKLQRGDELTRGDRAFLNQWGRAHPSDPRSHLLLGRHFTAARSLSSAFPHYEQAISIDASVCDWPQMLDDLLEMARSRTFARRAANLIVEAYGSRAIESVQAQLEVRRRRDETQRLESLLERLQTPG